MTRKAVIDECVSDFGRRLGKEGNYCPAHGKTAEVVEKC